MLPTLIPHKISHRGKTRWRVIIRRGWGTILKCADTSRRVFKTLAEAARFVKQCEDRLLTYGATGCPFSPADFDTVQLALNLVGGEPATLVEAARQYRESVVAAPKPKSRTVAVVIRHYLWYRQSTKSIRPKTLQQYRYELGKFGKTFGGKALAGLQRSDLELWLGRLALSSKAKQNLARTLSRFFQHAQNFKIRSDNPALQLELPRVDQGTPERLTVPQVEQLLIAAVREKSGFLAPLVLGLFAGVRVAEICRLDWSNVLIEDGRINIPGQVGKTHRYRWVPIPDLLRQWLAYLRPPQKGPIIQRHSVDIYESLRKELMPKARLATWPHNALRHSYTSFEYALEGNLKNLAQKAGNSPQVLRTNYIAPATRQEAERFLKLTPRQIEALAQTQAGKPQATPPLVPAAKARKPKRRQARTPK